MIDSLPQSIQEIFRNGDHYYTFDSEEELDNIESMGVLKDRLNIVSGKRLEQKYELHTDDGTCILLTEPDRFLVARIDSGGRGDMYSHGFEVTMYSFENIAAFNKFLTT